LVVKDAGKAGEKVCFYAADTLSGDDVRHGFRSLGPPSAVRRLVADVDTALGAAAAAAAKTAAYLPSSSSSYPSITETTQSSLATTTAQAAERAAAARAAAVAAAAKASSRPELFLSSTWPLAVDAVRIAYEYDICGAQYGSAGAVQDSNGGNRDSSGGSAAGGGSVSCISSDAGGSSVSGMGSGSGSGAVMTDGNGLICARLASMIPNISQGMPMQHPLSLLAPEMLPASPPVLPDHLAQATTPLVPALRRDQEVDRGVLGPENTHCEAPEAPHGISQPVPAAAPAPAPAAAVSEPAVVVQLRVYDPRVGAVIKGTFTPVVSGLPPGAWLLVRASQVKAPSWSRVAALMGRTAPNGPANQPPPTQALPSPPLAATTAVSGPHPAPLAHLAPLSQPLQPTHAPAPAAAPTAAAGRSSQQHPAPFTSPSSAASLPQLVVVQPPTTTTNPQPPIQIPPPPPPPPPSKRPGCSLKQQQQLLLSRLLLPQRRMQPGAALASSSATAAAAAAAAAAATVTQGTAAVTAAAAAAGVTSPAAVTPAWLEVVRKLPSRVGSVARLNGPLLLLLTACCVNARTLYDILEEEIRRILIVQRGEDLTTALEMARRNGDIALESVLTAELSYGSSGSDVDGHTNVLHDPNGSRKDPRPDHNVSGSGSPSGSPRTSAVGFWLR
ncbi:hypothetical protein Agub_g8016, partial [Astrephomene gubernaculifera]